MADYEWNWPTRIDRDAIEAALRLEFLDGGRYVVLVAPQGLGKTMIARFHTVDARDRPTNTENTTHTHSVAAGAGDSETRPKSYGVNFCIYY